MLNIGIEIPEDHVTQKCCVLAMTGSGKSYGVGDIIEEYCKKDFPFVMIDVLGAHYGISEKYEVTILGGKKGQLLTPEQGELIADNIIKYNVNKLILDLNEWDDGDMQLFMADFLKKLFLLHQNLRIPRHVFVEEAEVFCPQVNYDNSRVSLIQMNKVMKRGRAMGLGMSLISQRPQDVNKRTLSQCLGSFIMHVEGIHEMEVINKMLKHETKERRNELLKMIKNAQKGECLLYAPQWIGEPIFFKFRKRETFHAGYTPELGKIVVEPPMKNPTYMPITTESVKKNEFESKRMGNVVVAGTVCFGIVLYLISLVI